MSIGGPHEVLPSHGAAARFRISFSISRVRLARRSRTSSARSSLVRPSLWPSSTSACRSQRCRHDPAIPRSAAIRAIGFSRSRASSTARRRNSGG